jgi:hypothetical protein
MMNMKTVLSVLLLAATAASAESIHIKGIRQATDAEKAYKTAFKQNLITGDIGRKEYTLEQLAAYLYYHFEVGKDYPVKKITNSEVKIQVTDKKGRESTESLHIMGVKEQ